MNFGNGSYSYFFPHFKIPFHKLSSFSYFGQHCGVKIYFVCRISHCIREAILLSKAPVYLLPNKIRPQILLPNDKYKDFRKFEHQLPIIASWFICSVIQYFSTKVLFYHHFPITITLIQLVFRFCHIFTIFFAHYSFLYFIFSFWIISPFLEIYPLMIS